MHEQPYRSHHRSETRWSHAYCTNLKSIGGAVPVGCQLHAPGAEEAVLTWGPPVKVNFELATPNSVHGCTLARPTWRRMIYWAGVHCARAVHVQVVCTLEIRTHLQVKWDAPLISNSQVTCILYQLKIHWGCRSCGVQVARARGGKPF